MSCLSLCREQERRQIPEIEEMLHDLGRFVSWFVASVIAGRTGEYGPGGRPDYDQPQQSDGPDVVLCCVFASVASAIDFAYYSPPSRCEPPLLCQPVKAVSQVQVAVLFLKRPVPTSGIERDTASDCSILSLESSVRCIHRTDHGAASKPDPAR